MSKDLNKVQLTGRLGLDPEIKHTQQGSMIATISVASNRRWRTAEGEDREDTEWFRVIAWNKLGEICGQYLKKGSKVYIEGRLQTHSWDDQATGQKRYATEVIASDMIMLESKHEDGPRHSDEVPDVGYAPEIEPEAPLAPLRQAPHAAAPSSGTGTDVPSSTGTNRMAPRPAPTTSPTAPRRPTAPAPIDDEDLSF